MRVVYTGGEGEITEKKSRFIATVKPVQSEEEAVAFINETKKKYWDARHNCSAFVIGERQELTRCSDDGEPAQTARCWMYFSGRRLRTLRLLLHAILEVCCLEQEGLCVPIRQRHRRDLQPAGSLKNVRDSIC